MPKLHVNVYRFLYRICYYGIFVFMVFTLYTKVSFTFPRQRTTHIIIPSRKLRDSSNVVLEDIFIDKDDGPVTEACHAKYGPTFEDNSNYILSYNLSAAMPYMQKLNLNHPLLPATIGSNVTVPVFVTACSSNHFKESMGLLKNIEKVVRPVIKDLKIVVFDLGLNTTEVEQLSVACRCNLRKFPLLDAPWYFQHLKGCPWKPIILQMILNEYPFVLWMDSSVRFTTGNLQPLFEKAKSSGIVLNFREKPRRDPSVRSQTHQETFSFLNEEACLYETKRMIEAGFVLLYAKEYILDFVLYPWTKCALIEECIWTSRPIREILKCFKADEAVRNHRCHRYDQSVLNILMYRLFHDKMHKHLVMECEYAYFRNPRRCRT